MKYFQSNPKKSNKPEKPLNEDEIWDSIQHSDVSDEGEDFDGEDFDDADFYEEAEEDLIQNESDEELESDDIAELEVGSEDDDNADQNDNDQNDNDDNKTQPKKRRKTESLAAKAKSLGYKGSFFDDSMSEFAPVEDFEFAFDPESVN